MSSEILSTLLLEYDQKKRKAELESEKRKQELYVKIPRLQEIETELKRPVVTTKNYIDLTKDEDMLEMKEKTIDFQ